VLEGPRWGPEMLIAFLLFLLRLSGWGSALCVLVRRKVWYFWTLGLQFERREKSLIMAASGGMVASLTTITSAPAYSPLTTPFTPPSWCSSEYNVYYTYSGSTTPYPYLLRDISCGSDGNPVLATECFPPAMLFPGITAWGADVVYSPAVGCPAGWRTLSNDGPPVSSTPGATTGTRVYACCPE
jgi:hypothetical protein